MESLQLENEIRRFHNNLKVIVGPAGTNPAAYASLIIDADKP